jgi:hypothetical protein
MVEEHLSAPGRNKTGQKPVNAGPAGVPRSLLVGAVGATTRGKVAPKEEIGSTL